MNLITNESLNPTLNKAVTTQQMVCGRAAKCSIIGSIQYFLSYRMIKAGLGLIMIGQNVLNYKHCRLCAMDLQAAGKTHREKRRTHHS